MPFKHSVKRMRMTRRQPTAKRALRLAKRAVRTLNKREIKTYSNAVTNASASSTGTVTQLAAMSQGDTRVARDGDDIQCRGLQIAIEAISNVASVVPTFARVVILKGVKERATAPTWASEFSATLSDHYTWRAWESRDQYKTVFDKTVKLIPAASADIDAYVRRFRIRLRHTMRFTASTTTCEDGGLYLMVVTNQATDTPIVNVYSRFFFTDL